MESSERSLDLFLDLIKHSPVTNYKSREIERRKDLISPDETLLRTEEFETIGKK